jgi:hypothetical protein
LTVLSQFSIKSKKFCSELQFFFIADWKLKLRSSKVLRIWLHEGLGDVGNFSLAANSVDLQALGDELAE